MKRQIARLTYPWHGLKLRSIVSRMGGRFGKRYLLPLLMVLPVVVYACLAHTVIVSKTEDRENTEKIRELESLQFRLNDLKHQLVTTCRDYAYWDDTYAQIRKPDKAWTKANLESSLGNSYGFNLISLQNESGNAVWERGLDRATTSDIGKYGVLQACLQGREVSGVLLLNKRTYICAAIPVRGDDARRTPRGMLFAGIRVDESVLERLEAGGGRKLTLCQSNGRVMAISRLGPFSNLPARITGIISGGAAPDTVGLVLSKDKRVSYGLLPIYDIYDTAIGTIIEVDSRESLLSHLKTIQRLSMLLVMLCVGLGLAAASYFRNRTLAKKASQDLLTGLYNHGYLQENLKSEVARARRYGNPLSVLMVDIDHFKVVNDTCGHAVGDYVLRTLSDILLSSVRETDIVARYGGEELMAVLPETDLYDAMASAERIRVAVQNHLFAPPDSKLARYESELKITVSVGVAAYPDDAADAASLASAADVALAAAKATRNQVVSYQSATEQKQEDRGKSKMLEGFLRDPRLSVIRPLVAAINHRIPGSETHSEKVAFYAVQIGRELGWSTQELATTCKAAMLMDIGKIGVSDEVLSRDGPLSSEEMEMVRGHTTIGAEMISRSPQLAQVSDIVKHHHERYDGLGYPDGLAGGEIPLLSRVLSVADALVAMMSARAYREAKSPENTIAELKGLSGRQFDPEVVEAAVQVIRRGVRAEGGKRNAA